MKASDFFSPHQLGVAGPYGIEKIVHGLCICIEEHVNDNDFVVMKIHCATAFSMQSYAESAYQPYADGYH